MVEDTPSSPIITRKPILFGGGWMAREWALNHVSGYRISTEQTSFYLHISASEAWSCLFYRRCNKDSESLNTLPSNNGARIQSASPSS